MLQPPASGSGPWTQTVIQSFTTKTSVTQAVSDPIIDSQGRLYFIGQKFSHQSCPADPNACPGIYQLTPNATRTSWTLTRIARTAKPISQPVLDKAGNIFFGVYGTSTTASVEELSPPLVPGGPWTRQTIWGSKPGQLIGPQSLTFGPDGNLDVFGYLGDGTGLFKLVRPVSHTGPWTYLPIYVAAKLHDAGYQPGGHLLIDKTGAAFFSALTGFDRVSPPTMLGQPWTVKQLLPSGGAHPILGALATDAFGEVLLYREGVGSLTIVSLTNTGFIPQRAPH